MYRKNRLLELVEQKHVPLGIQMFSGSAAIVEILGQTGFDFVMIDTEHSPPNARALEDLIRTAELAGLIPYVRVTSALSEVEVRLALEAGRRFCFHSSQRAAPYLPIGARGELQHVAHGTVFCVEQC
jgi:2-keto-3-deoxy-L-rhamnonate aldolase RhmA